MFFSQNNKIALSFVALLQIFWFVALLTGSTAVSNRFYESNGLKCGCNVGFC